jgi:small multidrug resistance pump
MMAKEEKLKNMMQIIVYIFFSSVGLILLKIGTNKKFELSFDSGNFLLGINYILIIGMLFYVASFLTSLIAMKGMQLSVFYPISAGMIYVMVCILSRVILHEEMTVKQIIGMCVILVGIIIMNIHK